MTELVVSEIILGETYIDTVSRIIGVATAITAYHKDSVRTVIIEWPSIDGISRNTIEVSELRLELYQGEENVGVYK